MRRIRKDKHVAETHKIVEKTQKLDLRKPKDCKKFLTSIKIDGRKVTHFDLEDGKRITVKDMDDSMLIQYANDIYFDLFSGKDGGGFVNTEIDRGLN